MLSCSAFFCYFLNQNILPDQMPLPVHLSSRVIYFLQFCCAFSNKDDDNNDDDRTDDGGDDDGRLEQADHRRGGLRARGAQILGGGEAVAPTAARPTREAEKHLEQRILLRGRSPLGLSGYFIYDVQRSKRMRKGVLRDKCPKFFYY